MRTPAFRSILPYQKVNHFPGTFHLGRKDRLWQNIHKMQLKFGFDQFNIIPKSFVLPRDAQLLKEEMQANADFAQQYIIKPVKKYKTY